MRFGRSAAEAAEEPSRGGAGGDFIKYLREGDTTFRILQDRDDGWVYYWEHFSPMGFSFPCTNEEDTCPGCISDNEKMKKVGRKIAFNVLESFNGTDYVNVYKVPSTVASKLENRIARFGTVTDRDYTITKYKTTGDRWDFDLEGDTPTPVPIERFELKDIEAMLAESFDEAWGDGEQAQANRAQAGTAPARASVARTSRRPTIAPQEPAVGMEEPPFEGKPKVYREEDLRKMDHGDLLVLIKQDMEMVPPATLTTSDAVVDWLMEIQS